MASIPPRHHACTCSTGARWRLPGLVDNSLVADVALYSRIELIEPTPNRRSCRNVWVGTTPPTWCHYYQQMDLARQAGNWHEVARLADEAPGQGPDTGRCLGVDAGPGGLCDAWSASRKCGTPLRSSAPTIRPGRSCACSCRRGSVYPGPYDYNLVNQALCQAN